MWVSRNNKVIEDVRYRPYDIAGKNIPSNSRRPRVEELLSPFPQPQFKNSRPKKG